MACRSANRICEDRRPGHPTVLASRGSQSLTRKARRTVWWCGWNKPAFFVVRMKISTFGEQQSFHMRLRRTSGMAAICIDGSERHQTRPQCSRPRAVLRGRCLPHAFARGRRGWKPQSDFSGLFQGHDYALRRSRHFDGAPCRRPMRNGIRPAEGFINADRGEMRRLATFHVD